MMVVMLLKLHSLKITDKNSGQHHTELPNFKDMVKYHDFLLVSQVNKQTRKMNAESCQNLKT